MLQLNREMIKYQGLSITLSKNRSELPSKYGKTGGFSKDV